MWRIYLHFIGPEYIFDQTVTHPPRTYLLRIFAMTSKQSLFSKLTCNLLQLKPVIGLISAACLVLVPTFAMAQSKPFPQNVTYANGFKAASANLNDGDATNMYADWVNKFYLDLGNGKARIKWSGGSGWPGVTGTQTDWTASEAMGYGMVITAYKGDKVKFDKLLAFYDFALSAKATRIGGGAVGTNYLMPWLVNGSALPCDGVNGCVGGGVDGNNPATDGDIDAAFALLVAQAQWGGTYQARAVQILTVIKTGYLQQCAAAGMNWLIKPGNFGGCTGGTNAEHDMSYYAPGYFRLFATVTGDATWTTLANNSYYHLTKAGGMLPPDFQKPDGTAPAGNPVRYYEYGYDAARTPWRMATDYIWHGQASGATGYNWLNQITSWVVNTLGGAINIKNGYSKSGTLLGTWNGSAAFIGGFATGAMASSQTNVNNFSTRLKDAYYGMCPWDAANTNACTMEYYDLSLSVLYSFTLTGNFWYPGTAAPVNKLTNSTFDTALTGWSTSLGGTGAATFSIVTGTAKATITAAGVNSYDIQMSQNTTITVGKSYKVEFDGRITEGTSRTMGINIEKAASPYTQYGTASFSLTTSWNHFTYTYTAVSATDTGARIVLQLGANVNDVNVDNVTLVEL
jgi:endoglucanase